MLLGDRCVPCSFIGRVRCIFDVRWLPFFPLPFFLPHQIGLSNASELVYFDGRYAIGQTLSDTPFVALSYAEGRRLITSLSVSFPTLLAVCAQTATVSDLPHTSIFDTRARAVHSISYEAQYPATKRSSLTDYKRNPDFANQSNPQTLSHSILPLARLLVPWPSHPPSSAPTCSSLRGSSRHWRLSFRSRSDV